MIITKYLIMKSTILDGDLMNKLNSYKTEIQELCKEALDLLIIAKQKHIISDSEFEKLSIKKKMFTN